MPLPSTPLSDLREAADELVRLGQGFYQRGWMLGTSGNLSSVLTRAGEGSVRLAITASSIEKGRMRTDQILEVDENGRASNQERGRPSAETRVHLEVVRMAGAGAVLHTHSVWGTALSDYHGDAGGFWIEGYEMLKGLDGVTTHEHREWLPIVENTQDMTLLAERARSVLAATPRPHGFLVRLHGLYTWGVDLSTAARHVEILEFLLEAVGRRRMMEPSR